MKLTTKKTLWVFAMVIVLSMLMLTITSRIKLSSEVIIGGADGAFVETTGLKNALDDYDEVGKVIIRAPEGLSYPKIEITDWRYLLVNKDNSVKTYTPELKKASNEGVLVDSRIVSPLNDMIKAAEEEGFTPYVNCAYLSYSYQKQLFDEKVSQLVANGDYSYDEAQEVAKKYVEEPGTNEHQSGLAVDIFDAYYEAPDYSKMDPAFFEWLDEHCAEFGFIKRYPSELKTLTGYDEPWHYRYVGKEVAAFIMENELCFEQFEIYYH